MKKKLIAVVLMLALVLTFGLVACGPSETVYKAATYGHNGIAFTEITFKDNKIASLYIDEIEFSFMNATTWFKDSTAVTLQASDYRDAEKTAAKYIKIDGKTFTWNGSCYLEDDSSSGTNAKTELWASSNTNKAKWSDELALWVTESIRAGKYWVLKADGTAYDIPFTVSSTNKNTLEHDGDEAVFQYGCGAHSKESVDKEHRFVKSWTYYFRNDNEHKWLASNAIPEGVEKLNVTGYQPSTEETPRTSAGKDTAAGKPIHFYNDLKNLSYDENIAAMVKFIMETKGGVVPANYGTKERIGATGDNPNFWKFEGVTTGATFNDWNNYMNLVLKAVAKAKA